MPRHRAETRHLRTGVAGLAVVLGLWCTGDSAAPTHPATTQRPVAADPVPLAAPVPPAVSLPPEATASSSPPGGNPAPGTAGPGAATTSGPGAATPSGPPDPPSAGTSALPAPGATASGAPAPGAPARGPASEPRPRALPASAPVRLTIGAIGVEDRLMTLDRRPDRTLEVPPEHPGAPAGWYRRSPAPGQVGPAVLLGHVNATGGGPGVFADLHRLTAGDRIVVARADGSTAEFAVDAVERHAKDSFPTLRVYGNTAGPELRLVTCDGFDPATGSFDENLVVYASLIRS
ncbi:class F sortase [Kocuria oceani]|uniref:class F sortase n=1 Tax=Kocuria oceani TaxID=988827 RepID=UPI0040354F69